MASASAVPAGDHAQAPAPAVAVPLRRYERERAARKQAEQLLTDKSQALFEALQSSRDAERRLQLALWASGEGIWEWRSEDGLLRAQGLLVAGQPVASPPLSMESLLQRVHAEDRAALSIAWQLHVGGSRPDIDTACRIRVGGSMRWLRLRGRALQRDGSGRPAAIYGTVKDVTDQRDAEHALHLLAQAFASTLDALVVVDDRWQIVQANESFRALAGSTEAAEGRLLSDWIELPPQVIDGRGAPWEGEATLARGDLSTLPVSVSVTSVAERAGQGRCHIIVLRDISERQRQDRELKRLAREDPLTGLPNRGALDAELDRRLAAGEPFALLFMDLDGFKSINDSLGHGVGDLLLREVGRRLSAALPEQFVARWGGDEFAILGHPGSGERELREIAAVLLREVSRSCTIDGHPLHVTPSLGGVWHPEHGSDAQTLIRRADVSMYAAKDAGRGQLVVFSAELDAQVRRRARLQALLRVDAARDAFSFVLQPKVDAAGTHIGAELLMRWSPPAIGPVSPAEFIPIAEQLGLIDRMGRQALRAAARVSRAVRELGSIATVAVNLSPRQLLRPDFEQIIEEACASERCEPGWLELELTESALVTDIAVVEQLLRRLRDRGFLLALDDFGTGYSSLSHLRRLPFHKVKIDRSFVNDLTTDTRSRQMLEGIVQLCSGVGLTMVAEGVESASQFEILRALGIDEFQGFLFARPQSQAAWFEALRRQAGGHRG